MENKEEDWWMEILFGTQDIKRPKKYDEKEITIRLNNLKKLLGEQRVDMEIAFQKRYTNNMVDYLNLAYYSLKDIYCKIHRWRFGLVRKIEYEKKISEWQTYNEYYSTSADYTSPYINTNLVYNSIYATNR